MLSEADFRALADRVDRRAAWGSDDDLGALHYLTAAATVAAVREVAEGVVVPCAATGRAGLATISTRIDAADHWKAVNETVTIEQHGAGSMTHLDALGHFYFDGTSHGGVGEDAIRPDGVSRLDITGAARGIVGRGMLLDLPAITGTDYVPLSRDVTLAEVQSWLERHGVSPLPGDVLFVRTGAPHAPLGEAGLPEVGSLSMDCVTWVHDSQFALIVSDAGLDSPRLIVEHVATPWHVLTIARMGVRLVDFANLEELAHACATRGRATFLAVVAAPPLTGATASPVNPLAVL